MYRLEKLVDGIWNLLQFFLYPLANMHYVIVAKSKISACFAVSFQEGPFWSIFFLLKNLTNPELDSAQTLYL